MTKNRAGFATARGTNETMLSYRRQAGSDEIYYPFQKSLLSKAALKVGGEGNDTAYYLQDDGRIAKQKCVTFPFSLFNPAKKQKLAEAVRHSRKRSNIEMESKNQPQVI